MVPPGFFSELRRRRVFRTAGAYLAGAFIVLQVADLVFEPLGFPAAAYRALIVATAVGFPVALVLSWFFDVRKSEDRPRFTSKTAAIGAGVFLLLVTAAMVYGIVRHWRRADYDGSAVIAVLPFKIVGSSDLAYLETGLVEMLSRNIDGAAGLRAVAPDMVLTYAKEKSATEPTDVLAEKLSARYLVSGNVSQAGQKIRITATVHDYEKASGDPVVVEGTPEELFSVVDRISARILAATRKGQDADLSRSAAVTTNSLQALRQYLQGEELYRRNQYDSAASYFSQAVHTDTTFALAYYRLALSQISSTNEEAARSSSVRALAHSGRLTQRDRSLLQAFAEMMDGNYARAEQRYRALLQEHPGDMEASYLLAELLATFNPYKGRSPREAEPFIAQVAAADPEFLCPI